MNKYLNVLVLFRNNEKLVAPYFFFLRRSTKIPLRVFALNNGSDDNTLKEIQKYKMPQDIALTVPENVGTSKGRNIVLREIWKQEGGYCDVLCTDSDMFFIRENSIDRMVETNLPMVYAMTLAFDDNRQESDGGIWCALYKKPVWELNKEFDEGYYNYYDDTDLFVNSLKHGLKATKCPLAQCLHIWGSTNSTGTEAETRMVVLAKDKARMVERWGEKYA